EGGRGPGAVGSVGERRRSAAQRPELLGADGAAAEMSLEDAPLLLVESGQDVRRDLLVDVVPTHRGPSQNMYGATFSAPSAGAMRWNDRRASEKWAMWSSRPNTRSSLSAHLREGAQGHGEAEREHDERTHGGQQAD